jgi:hypothetical protein
MSVPAVPQNEPQDSKNAKNVIIRDSLITNVKKSYDNTKNPLPKKKKASLLNKDVIDPATSFQIWKYPN